MEILPAPNDASAVFRFAMSFDGYRFCGSFEATAAAAALRRRACLSDLRIELFFQARASRHGDDDEYLALYRELLPLFRALLAEI